MIGHLCILTGWRADREEFPVEIDVTGPDADRAREIAKVPADLPDRSFLRYPVTREQAVMIAADPSLPDDVVEWELVLQRLHQWRR